MKLFLMVLVMSCWSCSNNTAKKETNVSNSSDVRFKVWLIDTLEKINTNRGRYFQKINITKDSLSLDIKNYYKLKLGPNYNGENPDLIYAMDLLARNDNVPKKKFMLEFEIQHYYTVSDVQQLNYNFDSEILKFNVEYSDSSFTYQFMKGNLIERKSFFKPNH